MARKHQKGEGPTPTVPGSPGVDPALALFASYVRGEEQRERDAKRAARKDREKAQAADLLLASKDAAAADVKRLRGREGVSAEQRAAADAAYRDALAALVAAETGEAPAWAPPSIDSENQAEANLEVRDETPDAAPDAAENGAAVAEADAAEVVPGTAETDEATTETET